jgi:hypothetical protein
MYWIGSYCQRQCVAGSTADLGLSIMNDKDNFAIEGIAGEITDDGIFDIGAECVNK